MTTAERLAAIKEWVEKATEGPFTEEADMRFAYAARADIPWMLEYIVTLEEALKSEVREDIARCLEQVDKMLNEDD